MQNRSFVEGSPHCDIKDSEVRNANKTERNDKSVLSDFPARLTRRQRRERTRNGVSNGDPIEKFDHVVDIDEVAQREHKILEAQRNERYHKNRRRRQSSENSNECYSSGDPDKRYNKRMEMENGDDRGQNNVNRIDLLRGGSASADVCVFFLLLVTVRAKPGGDGERPSPKEVSTVHRCTVMIRICAERTTRPHKYNTDVRVTRGRHLSQTRAHPTLTMDPRRASGLRMRPTRRKSKSEDLMLCKERLERADYKKKGLEVLDGNLLAKDEVLLHFHVVDLQFDFPTLLAPKGRSVGSRRGGKRQPDGSVVKPKTKVILTLQLLSPPRRRSGQSAAFVLSYFPVDVPEYLVLTNRVIAALSRTWKPLDPFRILFLHEDKAWQYYTGKVISVKSTLRTTMWNSIEVEYDNESGREKENLDLVSP
ncbi:hypothetical protein FGB62_172g07 [Gracilaria domingensis]|nr:hypothetical protein FGB62_172g07 [Gracilaria domingensis]